MKLILVRHGRSIANDEGHHQGRDNEWRDTSLHERGVMQAKKVSERLKGEGVDVIYSSPMKRARETAREIIQNHNLELIIDERIEEKMDNETWGEFIGRCKEFLNEISKQNKTFLVATHGGVILTLLAISTGDREKGRNIAKKYEQNIGNTSVTIIKKNGDAFERSLIGCKKHRDD